MGADEVRRRTAEEWVAKAEDDLKVAVHALGLGAECPAGVVCFLAQQCAEKYLKALLTANSIEFPKIHDIERLTSLLPAPVRAPLGIEAQRELTSHAIAPRYPSSDEPITLAEARHAVRLAKRVRAAMRKRLSKPEGRR